MPLQIADRVQQSGSANTTVSFTLSGTVLGFQTFSAAVTVGNTTYYAATDGLNWEVGIGTLTNSTTLTRTTILSSSNSNAAVSTFASPINIWIDYPSSIAAYASNNPGTSGQALVSNGAGVAPSWQPITAGAAGSTTEVQYNNAGALAGASNFTYTGNDVNIPFGPSNSATPASRVALAISMMT
jgi:hypothetical protein